ncbi:MAG: hypothetical protein QOD69_3194 [Solirubrobacteraceae bacterium]|nr:hypothetical protein [Solirubrobacteraceae bacterium]
MREWPPISDPDVRAWMALDDDEWLPALMARAATFEKQRFTEAAYEFGLAYPWDRPTGSYVLRDGEVRPITDVDLQTFTADRHPLVTFGANGAPHRLIERFGGFADAADREVLVLTGHLHGFDVGANIVPVPYGAVPAILFHSPGTAVRAAILWLTALQVETLVFAELGYHLGRLDHAHFEVDEVDVMIDVVFAFVGRTGALRLDSAPVALAAVPARDRTARAMTQEELLHALGVMAFGPGTTAREMSRRCFDDQMSVVRALMPLTAPTAVQLPVGSWTRYSST